jgi:uncharacterized protein YdeI (YjbR/CyaY-like superfamily)
VSREDPTFFETAAALRDWLAVHHEKVPVLHVGYHNKGSKRPSVTYPESVDEALCFGWIDGVRHNVDAESYTVRFTPRRAGSVWSAINTRRALELIQAGRMRPSGLAAFEARDEQMTQLYSYGRDSGSLEENYTAQFKANAAAWSYFEAQAPSYRRTASWWVMSAKQEETRLRRLATLIEDCAAGRRVGVSLPRRNGR